MNWNRLDSRARLLFYLQALSRLVFFWLPVAAGAGIGASMGFGLMAGFVVGSGVALLALISSVWMPSLSFDRWAWALRDGDLLIASGVIVRNISAIPLQRIQHVDLRQGPVEQWFGLSKLLIFTASGSGADGYIPGLSLDVAGKLRDTLLAGSGDDAV